MAQDGASPLTRLVLVSILALFAVTAALYAILTPKWQAPDEPAHFNYIRTIGDTGTLPVLERGDYDQNYLESIKAARFPASMSIDTIRYESYQPPLYYIAAVPIYLLSRSGGLDAQVLALRLFSTVLGWMGLLVAFAVLREILPEDSIVPLAAVGLMATVPMHVAASASIGNDLAAELGLLLILWLAVRRIKNSITDRRFVILGGILFGAALLTKSTMYVTGGLLLAGAEATVQFARHNSRSVFAAARNLFYLLALAVLVSSPMFVRNILTYGITDPLGFARHDLVVVGQPTTAEMIAQYGLPHILFDFLAVTFKSFWAQFGWMGVLVDDRIYVLLFGLVGAALFGLALYAIELYRHRGLPTAQGYCIGLLALLTVTAGVDYIGYNSKFFQLQGRYLFPAMIAIAFFLVVGLREIIAREHQRAVFLSLYIGLVGLDLACLFLFIVPQLRIAS